MHKVLIICVVVPGHCRGLRRHGGEASKASGSELIISLCKAGQRQEALKVYEDMTAAPLPHAPLPSAAAPAGRWFEAQPEPTVSAQDPEAAEPNAPALPVLLQHADDRARLAANAAYVSRAPTMPNPLLESLSRSSASAPDSNASNASEAATAGNTSGLASSACVTQSSSHDLPEGTAPEQRDVDTAGTLLHRPPGFNKDPCLPEDTHSATHSLPSAASRDAPSESLNSQPPDTAHHAASDPLILIKPKRRGTTPLAGAQPQQPAVPLQAAKASTDAHAISSEAAARHAAEEEGQRGGAGGQGGGRMELHSSTRLSQRVAFPSIPATAALVHAFALAGDLYQCHRSVPCHVQQSWIPLKQLCRCYAACFMLHINRSGTPAF